LKDNASLQKYQREAQKQAELKQMIEGMISKVLDMETQIVEVTKYVDESNILHWKGINFYYRERDELSEELSQFKSVSIAEERQKLYTMQLVLNQVSLLFQSE
jgi:hypothetical protein